MAAPLLSALPPNLNLWAGCVVRVTAIDPTTGNTVAGVNVSDVSLEVTNLTGGPNEALVSGPFMFVPGPEA